MRRLLLKLVQYDMEEKLGRLEIAFPSIPTVDVEEFCQTIPCGLNLDIQLFPPHIFSLASSFDANGLISSTLATSDDSSWNIYGASADFIFLSRMRPKNFFLFNIWPLAAWGISVSQPHPMSLNDGTQPVHEHIDTYRYGFVVPLNVAFCHIRNKSR